MNTDFAEFPGLSPDQERALGALLEHPTTEAAAAAVGLTSRTVRRYLRDPDFLEAYRAARRELMRETTSRLQAASAMAVRTLRSVMADKSAPAPRVSAAKAVLEMAYRTSELEQLQERVERLEAARETKTQGQA